MQLDRRQVDRHAQVFQAAVMPLAQLTAGLVQNPFADIDNAAVLLGQGDEQVRRDQSPLGVLPAQQCFDADHFMAGIADLGLVDQIELIALQRTAQVLVEFTTHTHFAVQAGDIELVAIARAGLGQHHRLLGLLQQFLGIVTIVGKQGDADGCTQADALLTELQGRGQVVEYRLCELRCLVGLIDPGLDQGELITAQSGEAAQAPAVGAQTVGNRHQQTVTGLVTELLVYFLEVVQAAAEDGHATLAPAGISQNAGQLLLQHAAVGQAGQGVVLRHVQQVGFGFAALVGITLDRFEELVGLVNPDAQLVAFLPR